MLVLSRKVNEEIIIAGRIHVKVIEVKGNRIVLGIEAPTEIPVHRAEVCLAMKEFRNEDELVLVES